MKPSFLIILLTMVAYPAMLLPAAAQATPVTLVYDDSRNPIPFDQIYYMGNWNPQSGQYAADWHGFERYPMFDDGSHGDVTAGDHVWTTRTNLIASPGQLFEWAVDSDTIAENDWLGPCDPFLVEDAAPKIVTTHSMPEEAYASASEIAAAYGLDLSQAGPPRRIGDSDRILFTFRPDGAKQVFLAGTFNNWASNRGGVVTDGRTVMYPAQNGVWYRILTLTSPEVRYKYVIHWFDGEFDWLADPMVAQTDSDGNSVLNVQSLPETNGRPATPDSGSVRWTPYSHHAREQILAEAGNVLVYVRMNDNERCLAFENQYLLSEDIANKLAGKSVLFADAGDPTIRDDLREMDVFRVPALAWRSRNTGWNRYIFDMTKSPSSVLEFVASYVSTTADN